MPTETTQQRCDLLIVGGGVNGAGIARDAAGRGLSVILCEKDDLASHTSSASSKLIHGGLRYLEHYEFSLVRKALIERENLMRIAPNLIAPIRFVMPHVKGLRPYYLLRAGLFIYDHLARRELLPATKSIRFSEHESGVCLQSHLQRGFEYADGWVDDARLVVLNALDAKERGAQILTHTICEKIQPCQGRWKAQLSQFIGTDRAQTLDIDAGMIVNATGAWAAQFQSQLDVIGSRKKLRLIKGSHIIVKRLFTHQHAYLFQHPDGRIVFAIPYESEFTLIGTTDFEYQGDLNHLTISAQEVDYLCELCNHYFQQQISAADVVHSYSGVRPLVDDGRTDAQSITRDYRLEFLQDPAPALHVFGGKITTYRRLAEESVDQIAAHLNCQALAWTKNACLPGGDIVSALPTNQNVFGFSQFVDQCRQQYHCLPAELVSRMARAYGTRIHRVLAGCKDVASMGEQVVSGLYACELGYLLDTEFAHSAQDILWRRTKLGLHLPVTAGEIVDAWIKRRQA